MYGKIKAPTIVTIMDLYDSDTRTLIRTLGSVPLVAECTREVHKELIVQEVLGKQMKKWEKLIKRNGDDNLEPNLALNWSIYWFMLANLVKVSGKQVSFNSYNNIFLNSLS